MIKNREKMPKKESFYKEDYIVQYTRLEPGRVYSDFEGHYTHITDYGYREIYEWGAEPPVAERWFAYNYGEPTQITYFCNLNTPTGSMPMDTERY